MANQSLLIFYSPNDFVNTVNVVGNADIRHIFTESSEQSDICIEFRLK